MCIDATHGTNEYDYKLITLLVKDETDHGIPVGHCISAKESEVCITVFFKELFKKSGPIFVEYIMTDDAPQVSYSKKIE